MPDPSMLTEEEKRMFAANFVRSEIARLNNVLEQLEGPAPLNSPSGAFKAAEANATPAPIRPPRKKLSAAQRKAIGERMRSYWASKRKGSSR